MRNDSDGAFYAKMQEYFDAEMEKYYSPKAIAWPASR